MKRVLEYSCRNAVELIPYEKKITVTTPSNIAVLKYWGKRDDEYVIPLNDNISVTLNDLITTTTIFASKDYGSHSLVLNGEEDVVTVRLKNLIEMVVENEDSDQDFVDHFFRIESTNNFPTAAGLASSASGLGSIAFGLCNLLGYYDPRIWSCAARMGSGSACRSVFGGWVKWIVDDEMENNPLYSSYGIPLYDYNHWEDLRIMILVIEEQKKKISSTLGMSKSRENSKLLEDRVNRFIPSIIDDLETSIEEKDTETFFTLMMEDCENFHDCCLDTTPTLEYRNKTSLQICDLVRSYNEENGMVRVGYTFDAGPNAILFFENESVMDDFRDNFLEGNKISSIANIIPTKIGKGPEILSKIEIESSKEMESFFIDSKCERSGAFFNTEIFMKNLNTEFLGRSLSYKYETTSTMEDIQNEILKGSMNGSVVLSESQTQGRGQKRGDDPNKTRSWSSLLEGNLYFSFLLHSETVNLNRIALAVPIALCNSLESIGVQNPKIKWPNDILVNGKKISGILVQSKGNDGDIDMNIGIGINVNEDMNMNEVVKDTATSCFNEIGNLNFSREELLANFFNNLESTLLSEVDNSDDILNQYRKYCAFKIGEEILVMPEKKENSELHYLAKFMGVDENGYLMVEKSKGEIEKMIDQEVSIL